MVEADGRGRQVDLQQVQLATRPECQLPPATPTEAPGDCEAEGGPVQVTAFDVRTALVVSHYHVALSAHSRAGPPGGGGSRHGRGWS